MEIPAVTTASLNETYDFAQKFVELLVEDREKGERKSATVVGLYGELGAGKTAFTKGVAKALGITEEVTSPTFVIEKIYRLAGSFPFTQLIHIDAYRLEKGEELTRLGWNEILSNPSNLILIEWPERVMEIMPSDHTKLFFTFIDETKRTIKAQ